MTNELPPLPDLLDIDDLSHSAYEEALSFGLERNVFLRYFKTLERHYTQQMQEYARAAIAQAHKPLTHEHEQRVCYAVAKFAATTGMVSIECAAYIELYEAAHGIKGGEQ